MSGLQCVGTSATMAGTGKATKQQTDVSSVATRLFGSPVLPQGVIGENLKRSTTEPDYTDATAKSVLRNTIAAYAMPSGLEAYYAHPLSAWMESFFGLEREAESGALKRRKPRAIGERDGAAADLSALTGLDARECAKVIREHLLGGYSFEDPDKNGQPPFAFRIHQFFSRGDSAYASVEPKDLRYITVHGQHYVPDDRTRVLLPLVFCRECGADMYSVSLVDAEGGRRAESRSLSDVPRGEDAEAGYLMLLEGVNWPDEEEALVDIVPDDFLQIKKNGATVIKTDSRKYMPERVSVLPNGSLGRGGVAALFIPSPFRFCPRCGVAYSSRSQADFSKLATLGTEGRSSVITLLSLSMVRMLREDSSLPQEARKLLSFTDNRQDAGFLLLYAIAPDDVDYILATFQIMKCHNEEKYMEYWTNRVVMETYEVYAEVGR